MSAPTLVIVDKPAGMTSHNVVGRCRRLFGTHKVGHAGTLDPMATGVVVIDIDRATKILALLTTSAKSYTATIRLGQATSTEDAEANCCSTGRSADRPSSHRTARRGHAGAVGGQRDQGRRQAGLPVGP